jgi:hypothetical protein
MAGFLNLRRLTVEFEVSGDLFDEAIEPLAVLLLAVAEQEAVESKEMPETWSNESRS